MWILSLIILSFLNDEATVTATDLSLSKSCSYWSEWINNRHPDAGKAGIRTSARGRPIVFAGDREVVSPSELANDYSFCLEGEITDIECREAATGIDYTETGERNLSCNLEQGFRCRGKQQTAKICKDYKIRYYCTCSSNDVCNASASAVCLATAPLVTFPGTEQELESVCMIIQRAFHCLRNHAAKCDSEATAKVRGLEAQTEVLKEICRRDTRLHSNVVQNLRCLKVIFHPEEQMCHGFTRLSINYLYELVMLAGSQNADKYHVPKILDCLFVTILSNCFVLQTEEKCGSRAHSTVLEIMDKFNFLDDKCPDSVQENVLGLLDVLADASGQKIYLKKILESKN